MPTGGIRPDNVSQYLALGNVVACGGSWLASRSLLDARDYAEITRRAAVAARAATEHTTRKEESR
jgi:2-dehydro-3-deoxyphosphogluconate aldolase/(4S)-4-hydroxy-2-oxoglutarate aldolase